MSIRDFTEVSYQGHLRITGTKLQKFLADKKIIEKSIGDKIEFATIEVTVKSVDEKSIFNRKYSEPLVAREGAKFIIVSMDVKNITEGKFDFRGREISLVDGKNREYLPSHDLYSSDGDLAYREISPGLVESGILLYETPDDSMSYSLIMAKDGTNDVYKIVLKKEQEDILD